MATITDLQNKANSVANATQVGENSAARVGGALQDAASLIAALQNSAKTDEGNITTLQGAVNSLQSALADESKTRGEKDEALQNLISALQKQVDTLTGTNASDAIDNFNEVIKFLGGIKDDETLSALLEVIKERITALETLQKSGYRFMGVATPDTDPGMPAFRAAYLAVGVGTYANFHTGLMVAADGGNKEVQIQLSEGQAAFLKYDGYKNNVVGWYKEAIDLSDVVCGIVKQRLRGVEDGVAPLNREGVVPMDYLPVEAIRDELMVSCTQEEYDAMVKAGTVKDDTYYNILEE